MCVERRLIYFNMEKSNTISINENGELVESLGEITTSSKVRKHYQTIEGVTQFGSDRALLELRNNITFYYEDESDGNEKEGDW